MLRLYFYCHFIGSFIQTAQALLSLTKVCLLTPMIWSPLNLTFNLFVNIICMCGVNIFIISKNKKKEKQLPAYCCICYFVMWLMALLWKKLLPLSEFVCSLCHVIFTMLLSLQDVMATKQKKKTSEQDVCLLASPCLHRYISLSALYISLPDVAYKCASFSSIQHSYAVSIVLWSSLLR